jgi:type II secretory pathway pseudopilin PulG
MYSSICGAARRAITLVELLIVMGIIVMLAAVTLPNVRTMLKEQRVTQSAHSVQAYFEAAKARAVATQRPVAVILHRAGAADVSALNTCIRMSIGETFPPYAGDWEGAVGTLVDTTADGYASAIRIPLASAATLYDIDSNSFNGFISAGDYLVLGDQQHGYAIGDPVYIAQSQMIEIPFQNPSRGFRTSTNAYPLTEATWPVNLPTGPPQVKFRIYRKPSKSMVGSIVMPRGICVDLTNSGSGSIGREYFLAALPANATASDIFIVFNRRGTIDSVYSQTRINGSNVISVLPASGVLSTLHLMVGRSDQVLSPADLANPVSARDEFQANLTDTSNVWVSINPHSGLVYSSSNVASPTGDLAVARTLARNVRTQGGN